MIHTYHHTFSNGVKAKATVSDEAPFLNIEWTGRPDRALLRQYRKWRTMILGDFTKRTGKTILVVDLT